VSASASPVQWLRSRPRPEDARRGRGCLLDRPAAPPGRLVSAAANDAGLGCSSRIGQMHLAECPEWGGVTVRPGRAARPPLAARQGTGRGARPPVAPASSGSAAGSTGVAHASCAAHLARRCVSVASALAVSTPGFTSGRSYAPVGAALNSMSASQPVKRSRRRTDLRRWCASRDSRCTPFDVDCGLVRLAVLLYAHQ
jgi:hypothetical protein